MPESAARDPSGNLRPGDLALACEAVDRSNAVCVKSCMGIWGASRLDAVKERELWGNIGIDLSGITP